MFITRFNTSLCIILFIISNVFVTSLFSQLSYGVVTGGQLSNVSSRRTVILSDSISLERFQPLPNSFFQRSAFKCFYGGIIAQAEITNFIIFRIGLQYSYKGWNEVNYRGTSFNTEGSTLKIRIHSGILPVTFLYSAPTEKGKFYIGTGPYLSYHINGTYQNSDSDRKVPIRYETNNSSGSDSSINRFDIGLNSVIGYSFNSGLFVEAGYESGLKEIFRQKETGVNTKFTLFKLGVGYFVNKKVR